VRLTVLGNADRYLAPQAEGSAYLVEAAGRRVLLDCGHGTLARVPEPETLDAVVISHFHYDHVIDLAPLMKCLRAGTTLVVPPGGREALDRYARAFEFRGAFDAPGPVFEAAAGAELALEAGSLLLKFAATEHGVPSFATRVEGDRRSLVYASDTARCAALGRLARDADVLLAHTLLPSVESGSDHARRHLTARSAADLARDARSGALLLSHRFHEVPRAAYLEAAPSALLAETGRTYEI